jgi:O-antigen/teichoic acid export membrane protein
MVPKQVVALLLVPRLGWLLANGGETQLTREFDACRGLVLLTTMVGIIVFALAGPTVLGLFGGGEDYQAAFHVLLILSVAMLVRSAFGHGVQLLNQAGMAGWTLLSTLAASAALVAGMVAGVPILGAVGGAWAVTLSAVVSHGLIAFVLYARPGLSTMRSGVALVLACSAAVLIMMATGMVGPLAAALALAMCSAGLAALYAGEARRVLGILRNRRRPVAG